MTIQFRNVSTDSGSAQADVAPPTGTAAGDIIILLVGLANEAQTPTASEFTLLAATVQQGNNPGIHVYWRIATGSEPATYTITWTSGNGAGIAVGFYSDDGDDLSVDDSDSQANASPIDRVFPSLTASVVNTMMVCLAALDVNTGSTPSVGAAERLDALVGLSGRYYVQTEPIAASGATGTREATGGSSNSNCAAVLIKETAAAGPPSDPSGLVATATGQSSINLTWVDNSSDEDGFAIERSLTGVGSWVEIDTVAAGVETYDDTGLDPDTEYFYRVRAFRIDP